MKRNLFFLGFILLVGILLSDACMPTPTDQPGSIVEVPAPPVEETAEVVVVTEVVEVEPELPETVVVEKNVQTEEATQVAVLEVEAEQPAEPVLWFQVLRGTGFLNGAAVSAGEIIVGDRFETDPNGFVEMGLMNDSRVLFEIKPNTSLVPEEITYNKVRLFLEIGSIRTAVEDEAGLRVVIAAEAGESEAGGTIWLSEVDTTGALLVAVLEGRVIARGEGGIEVAVNEKELSKIIKGEPPGWPESTIFIYFSTFLGDRSTFTHQTDPPTLSGRYLYLARALRNAGFFIEESESLKPLQTFDVLITFHVPDEPYGLSDEGNQIIQNWVSGGKGMFVSTHWTDCSFDDPINRLLEPFEIRISGDVFENQDATMDPDHPITADVPILPLYASCFLEGGIVLGETNTGQNVLAAYENGGRVLVLPDSETLTNIAWDDYAQGTFIINAVKWLAWQE